VLRRAMFVVYGFVSQIIAFMEFVSKTVKTMEARSKLAPWKQTSSVDTTVDTSGFQNPL
jgi:hypothetical protein